MINPLEGSNGQRETKRTNTGNGNGKRTGGWEAKDQDDATTREKREGGRGVREAGKIIRTAGSEIRKR